MRRFLAVSLLVLSSFGTAHALGRLETKLAEVGPTAIAARTAERRNAKAVKQTLRMLAARPDVQAVLAGGGELILGIKDASKVHVRARVYKTPSAVLVMRAPKTGKTQPRLTIRSLTVTEGEDFIGFGASRPTKSIEASNKGNFHYTKGGTAKEKAELDAAIEFFGLTPGKIEDAVVFTP